MLNVIHTQSHRPLINDCHGHLCVCVFLYARYFLQCFQSVKSRKQGAFTVKWLMPFTQIVTRNSATPYTAGKGINISERELMPPLGGKYDTFTLRMRSLSPLIIINICWHMGRDLAQIGGYPFGIGVRRGRVTLPFTEFGVKWSRCHLKKMSCW